MFKIRDLFKKNSVNSNIIYENGIVKDEINSWCRDIGVRDKNDLFRMLDIDTDKKIYLYQDYSSRNSIIYSVGIDKIDNNSFIRFNSKRREIVVNDRNISKCYRIVLDDEFYYDGDPVMDNNLSIYLDLVYCKKRIDDKTIIYYRINNNNSLFVIDNGLYELTLEIDSYANICDCEYNDLEIYLSSLEFPIEIDKVYSDICYILSLEQDIMDRFNLVVTKSIDRKRPDRVMDEIMIEKGVLERFTKTKDNMCVMLDKSGNFKYNRIDGDSKYSYKWNNMDANDENISMLDDNIKNEVYNVKKLVRDMFK